MSYTGLELQILRGTHFKATTEGHLRPLYTKEYYTSMGHQGQVRGHQRPWPQMASGKFKPWSYSSVYLDFQPFLFDRFSFG